MLKLRSEAVLTGSKTLPAFGVLTNLAVALTPPIFASAADFKTRFACRLIVLPKEGALDLERPELPSKSWQLQLAPTFPTSKYTKAFEALKSRGPWIFRFCRILRILNESLGRCGSCLTFAVILAKAGGPHPILRRFLYSGADNATHRRPMFRVWCRKTRNPTRLPENRYPR